MINCTILDDPENGQVTFTPGVVMTLETGLGAVANYTCNEGYDLVGDTLRTCEANGQWDGGDPMCMGTYFLWRYTFTIYSHILPPV